MKRFRYLGICIDAVEIRAARPPVASTSKTPYTARMLRFLHQEKVVLSGIRRIEIVGAVEDSSPLTVRIQPLMVALVNVAFHC